MPFSSATITSVSPPVHKGNFVVLSWTSSSPAGTWFQVYSGGKLVDWTTDRRAEIPWPATGSDRIVIGTVGAGEETDDFSASLPAAPDRRIRVGWQGGDFEGADLAGFHIYMGPAPGQAVSYAKPVATIAAYPGGIDPGGTGSYSWESSPLANGTWQIAVKPYDTAGNEGTAVAGPATIAAPPWEVPPFGDGLRLHYAVNNEGEAPGTLPTVTLEWNASPG